MVTADATVNRGYQGIRPYLFSVAYRMTGSASDAEDLVQDAWIRYLDAGAPAVDSLRAYLTTIVSRLALDYLKSARVQREQYIGAWLPEPVPTSSVLPGPADVVEERESVSLAFLTLLEQLGPEQRVVFVLREAFDCSYDDIAAQIGKSAAACRQIFHRARARIAGARQPSIAALDQHQRTLEQFYAALTNGNAAEAARLLAEDVAWIGDGGGERLAARRIIMGRDRVSRGITGFVSKTTPQMRITTDVTELNGAPALVVRSHGALDRVMVLDIGRDGLIHAVRVVLNPRKLQYLERQLREDVR